MASLDTEYYFLGLFHLGMSGLSGVDVGDLQVYNYRVLNIPSTSIKRKIMFQIDACERAWVRLEMVEEPSNYKSLTTGDVNRTEVRFDIGESQRRWNEEYLIQTDRLANILKCPNYWRDDEARYRYTLFGGFTQANPIIADSAISDSLYLVDLVAGGTGF
jgi:hypothetical protein